ncbi:MAG: YlmC/YmxH family sporulation protein, partial [Lachnospiraceae bacterium]|nr:YlmC/YmxH family sporulation protein [Lachnospiraceae bacterium]
MRICELKEKEVINICDCKRIGCVADLEINPVTGCIEAIIVPESGKFCGIFGKANEYVVPWKCIR